TEMTLPSLRGALATKQSRGRVMRAIGRGYGPHRRADCHLGSMIRDAGAGRVTEIPCDPQFIYHYVHVDDVAEALIVALEAEALPAQEYNVGSGQALTMPEIADIARKAVPGAAVT